MTKQGGGFGPRPWQGAEMTDALERWDDFRTGGLAPGQWARLETPQLHCEGWGADKPGRCPSEKCDGGTGLWATRRARWIRWDGVLQCGTCHRHDVRRMKEQQ